LRKFLADSARTVIVTKNIDGYVSFWKVRQPLLQLQVDIPAKKKGASRRMDSRTIPWNLPRDKVPDLFGAPRVFAGRTGTIPGIRSINCLPSVLRIQGNAAPFFLDADGTIFYAEPRLEPFAKVCGMGRPCQISPYKI
jgi:hypothetical protein